MRNAIVLSSIGALLMTIGCAGISRSIPGATSVAQSVTSTVQSTTRGTLSESSAPEDDTTRCRARDDEHYRDQNRDQDRGHRCQSLFVANAGNSTVTAYPLNDLATASPRRTSSGVNTPTGLMSLAFDASGDLFVANCGSACLGTGLGTVTEYAPPYTGAPIATISKDINAPLALAFDTSGDLFVANSGNGTVTEYPAGRYTAAPTVITTGLGPVALAFDPSGDLFVANAGDSTVTEYRYHHYAAPPTVISNGVSFPNALAFDPSGDLFVANSNNTVTEYRSDHYTGAPTIISNGVVYPLALAFDPSGDLFVANCVTNCAGGPTDTVTEYRSGHYTTLVATISHGVNVPTSLTFDPSGDLFVADSKPGAGSVTKYAPPYEGAPTVISTGIDTPYAMLVH
jgi:sugar lactone lactonase YvrE